ncbi:acyltransferase family protein [Eubacterium oxidoreducens]|uniref:Fucose 4-O-acetylase n=1 Tax=Eubacterium oxidoreducens TaxID=1732 RepID=A0A1G6CD39_EUBOX|nr:acyltransferase family protein [Eubacterium oxidoreducens]SDB30721.1 Fucose 4-O-acetylase [Eubacterium oxidoreducens]
MGTTKARDYMFDTFRGLLMLSIPMSHFTKMTGNLYSELYLNGSFPKDSLFGFVYITINVFVMQAFMFLSGFFSKKPERARQTAWSTFMWPYLVFTFLYFFVRWGFFGNAHLTFLSPPFALWFLWALFFYRFFLIDMVKFRWLLPVGLILYFVAGMVQEWGDFLALGRVLSYFVFFLFGYYCSKERLAWFQQLKTKKGILVILAAVLVASSILLCKFGPSVGWYLLRESYHSYHMQLWQDVLLRLMVLVLSTGWIILMINIIPSKKGFLAYVGANTMPIYMFHLTLRYVIEFKGLYVGFVACLVVAWFGILGIIGQKMKHKGVYIACIIISAACAVALFASGLLKSWYGLCPHSIVLTYILCYAGAIMVGIAFVSPFWIKLYDLLVGGTGKLPQLTRWLKGPGYEAED